MYVGLTMVEENHEPLAFGTLANCSERCLWVGKNGELVEANTFRDQMISTSNIEKNDYEHVRRNLELHMNYIEDVQKYASYIGHTFSYHMGVNERHLRDTTERSSLPQAFVERERHLQLKTSPVSSPRNLKVSASDLPKSLNWCSNNNPLKRSVCTAVKSQEKCGSCWAFAATDAIETAVSVVSNNNPVTLSSQQFLDCSTREMQRSFTYCWAEGGVRGAPWMTKTIVWKSKNNGCDGGMTHAAFQDAAQLGYGLLTELQMPYSDKNGVSSSNSSCITTSPNAAASITGWEQIVGKDCAATTDPNILLKMALQKQPIAIAINSADPFKDYKNGFYKCPNSGNLESKDDVDHALLLVGYDTDSTVGDYWILKNSYGAQWGNKGFMKLVADDKLNCGLNVFPVIPTGAQAGLASSVVDGGGTTVFVGLHPTAWIVVGGVVTALVLVLTIFGIIYARRRMASLREQNSDEALIAH